MHCTRLKAHDVIEGRNYVYNLPRCKSTKYMFSPVLRLVFLPHKFISFSISLRRKQWLSSSLHLLCSRHCVARAGGIVSSRWEASMAIQHGRHSLPPLFCLVC